MNETTPRAAHLAGVQAAPLRRMDPPGKGRLRHTPKGRQVAPADRARVAALCEGLAPRADLLIEHLHRLNDAEGALRKGQLANNNAELVDWGKQIIEKLGGEVATPGETRANQDVVRQFKDARSEIPQDLLPKDEDGDPILPAGPKEAEESRSWFSYATFGLFD